MPIYEYECQLCSEVLEIWQSLSEESATACPTCKGPLKKIISRSSFQLKGGGWFSDGYSNSSPAPAKSESAAPSSCPKASGGDCGSC